MKPWLFLVFCLLSILKNNAQEERLSIAISYPITVDNNFIGSNFNGIVDVGGKYRFAEAGVFNIAGGLNIGLLTNPANNDFGVDFTVNAFVFQPKCIIELRVPALSNFRPFIGLGVSVFTFASQQSLSAFEIAGIAETQTGFTISPGISYDIWGRIFVQLQYDFTSLSPDDDVPDIPFNSRVSLLKAGVGYRF